MREQSAARAERQRAQRGAGRGGARTMPRWLWAAMLFAAAGAGVAAWTPPQEPQLLTPRTRRSTQTATRQLQLLGWELELQENRAIKSPYYDECLFYKGRVIGEDESSATVTECAGQLYGLLQVDKEDFVLQPTHADGAHVLRRRDVLLSEHTAVYNLTSDMVTDLDLDFEEEEETIFAMPQVRPRHSKRVEEVDYFRAEPITRAASAGVNGLWLEIAIVADHTMMKFHGQERVKHYILALMNIVSAIFNDQSLNSNMTLVINKLFLYEEKDSIIKFGNAKKSLEGVNKWNYRHLIKLPAGSTGWDATVWLTRAPLGGPAGFAPVGGVCSKNRSAAIDRDEGLTSAFVIAHELAHLLGLTHDGEDSCEIEGSKGSVMAPTVLATLHNYAWSSCSKKQFHEKSKSWWCLHQRSQENGVELRGAKEISKNMFTMDEQCRTEFGEGYSVCRKVKVRSACSQLWCAHRSIPEVCRSKRAPPMEGTPCGKNKWCVDRVCEPMPGHGASSDVDRVGSTFDGEITKWSEWGPWGECSANCGYGWRSRTRRCRHGGSPSACSRADSQAATCWAGRACAAPRDARADSCRRQRSALIPHVPRDESKNCESWCMEYTGGEPTSFGSLPNGTGCSYEQPYDVCYQGTCVKGQCNSTDPACNWCPDGYCSNNTHVYTKHLGGGWTRLSVVPHGAHLLSMHIATPTPLHIALRERKRDKPILHIRNHSKRIEIQDEQDNYLKYDPNVPQNLQIVEVDSHVIDIKEGRYRWEGEVVAAGSVLRWRQTDTDIFISATARLQTDLMIMAIPENPIPPEELLSVQVAVNYSTPASVRHTRPLEYRWSTARGPCSASCGGGHRLVRPRCSRDMDKCPPSRYEPCNTHSCDFSWKSGEWEECSSTCGGAGVQERQLYCVPSNVSADSRRDQIRYSVSPSLCPLLKPDKQQACNRLPCPVSWREMPWTPCSTSCGRGISRRPLMCPASDELVCGPKPSERRRRCRVRRCPPPARLTITCPPSDTTQYCELFNTEELARHCQVPPFRKHCCNACRDVDRYRRLSRFG